MKTTGRTLWVAREIKRAPNHTPSYRIFSTKPLLLKNPDRWVGDEIDTFCAFDFEYVTGIKLTPGSMRRYKFQFTPVGKVQ